MRIHKDVKTLAIFCDIYCRSHHPDRERSEVRIKGEAATVMPRRPVILCEECSRLFIHGTVKRVLCPLEPRIACSRCPKPCYAPGYRESMKQVMRYSGKKMVFRGRLDYLLKFLI